MDTAFSIHLGLFFLLWSSEQQKTHKHKGDEKMNIPTKIAWFRFAEWFQRRR